MARIDRLESLALLPCVLVLILLLLHKLILHRGRRCTEAEAVVPRRSFLVPRPPRFVQGGALSVFWSKLPLPKESTKPSRNQLKKAKRRAHKAHSRAHVNTNTETDKTCPKSSDDNHSRAHVNPKTDKTDPNSGDDNTNTNLEANTDTNPRSIVHRAGLFRPELHGMDNYEKELMEFLEHGTTPLMGILGMSGVGKTTLLKLMRTYYNQLPYFRYILFVEAGKDFTIDMLSAVVCRDIGFGPIPVVNHISSFLRNQSFLLLLDDLQCAVDLADAGLPMELGPQQKIVFTTRDKTVLAEMGCAENTIRMHSLDEVTAWNLFVYLVGDKIINSHPDIKDLAKKMVAECHGNPGALCALGGLMSTMKNLEPWIVTNEMVVKSSSSCEIEEMENEGYPYLRFLKDVI